LRRALGQHDVYLNVAGGYRISEPAADLAVASALVSSLTGIALPADCVYFGEISLSGAVRPVAHAQQRLKEAEKLGFRKGGAALGSRGISALDCRGSDGSDRSSRPHSADLVARIAGSAARSRECGDEARFMTTG
jgi:DNA repair protein RadA/Sms